MNTKAEILIVDDDVHFLRALSIALNKQGHAVAGAADARTAMEYVVGGKHHFDLVLTDLQMPGLDGFGFLSAIKSAYPDTPVIMITAFGDLNTYTEALRKGAFSFLHKPVSAQQLLRTVERALGESIPQPEEKQPL